MSKVKLKPKFRSKVVRPFNHDHIIAIIKKKKRNMQKNNQSWFCSLSDPSYQIMSDHAVSHHIHS